MISISHCAKEWHQHSLADSVHEEVTVVENISTAIIYLC
jgi:hypothetical protein